MNNEEFRNQENLIEDQIKINSDATTMDNVTEEIIATAREARDEGVDIIEALDRLDEADEVKMNDEKSSFEDKIISVFSERHISKLIIVFLIGVAILVPLIVKMLTISVSISVDNEKSVKVENVGRLTTAEALQKAGITPDSKDVISKPLDEALSDGDKVEIISASRVFVTDGKKVVRVNTGLNKDQDVIKQAGFKQSTDRKISKLKYENVSVYGVLKSNQKIVKKNKNIKYKTVYKSVKTLNGKDEKVLKKGENGKVSIVSLVTKNKKGKIVKKKSIVKTIEKRTVNRVVAVALDSNNVIANGNGEPLKVRQKITVTCTAYCGCSICCGKSTGITASGTRATANRTIAAWSGLPFGTKVYFPNMKNNSNGGVYIVEDRGGAITSNRIDIYFSSHSQALSFGRRTMVAYILK